MYLDFFSGYVLIILTILSEYILIRESLHNFLKAMMIC